jgi:hypothetical protein
MKIRTIISSALFLLVVTSCVNIYQSIDAQDLARNQKTIAVIPSKVTIAARKNIDSESIRQQQLADGENFQNEIFNWFQKRQMQGNNIPNLQEINVTNSKLKKSGFLDNSYSYSELCSILNVDGIIFSSFQVSKPMSEGAAIAVAVLGGYSSTNQVSMDLGIFDNKGLKTIWDFKHTYSGGIGSNPTQLINGLMRKASKKLPY